MMVMRHTLALRPAKDHERQCMCTYTGWDEDQFGHAFYCTRPRGHSGPHVAHGLMNERTGERYIAKQWVDIHEEH